MGARERRGLGQQRLQADVAINHVGLIVGIDMSRLARYCKDWYQLLELCAVLQTLLVDQDGLYDPRQYNDRPLPGLKSTSVKRKYTSCDSA